MLFNKKQKKTDAKPKEVKEQPQEVGVSSKQAGQVKTAKNVYRVLMKPIITEKATTLSAFNKYIFEVAPQTTKSEVYKAVKELYNFKPIDINMLKVKGKNVRYGRSTGRTKNWKKAIVTLKKGDKINFTTH
ncbi:MAG: 50S ribosomal protein L23 [Patescibacteria group bacterium]|nr:50S ribosomal protein L23 [Patescibacteria group bacterium]MDD5121053.1 50S ribosomal protein L23 [Patescibacteria group bacterium]MDD5221585.1 50S ribosomal protein L23 [Patescibacteria group bacterium]MDD5396028.1 50S ribosomal protein L23 [Patescibacteria group bacterium]